MRCIVREGISPSLLMWKGIQAEVAESPNSKIGIKGNSGESLSVLLSANQHRCKCQAQCAEMYVVMGSQPAKSLVHTPMYGVL